MRKLLLFGLLVLAVVLVTSCAPLPENEGSSVITDPDQIESNTGALAGQAINAGCRSSNVVSCVSEANDISGTIKKSNGQVVNFRFTNGCRANDQVVTYKCTKPTQYQYCTTPCQAGQQCERGQCVVQCSDSDPQDDPTVMGTVTNSLGGVGGPVLLPQSDNCAPDGQLSQVECGPNRVISHTFSTCPDGQGCQNGACVCQSGSTELGTGQGSVTLISANLPTLLSAGNWATNEMSFPSTQELLIMVPPVEHTEDDNNDIMGNYLTFRYAHQIAQYTLHFNVAAQSDVTDSTGSADSRGTYLDDFEGTELTLLDNIYTVVLARRPDQRSPDQSVKLILMKGAQRDTLLKGELKTYVIGGQNYEVQLSEINANEATFMINGEATSKLQVGDTWVLGGANTLGVSNVLFQDYAGGIHSASFFLGAQKVELRDDQVTDVTGAYNVKIGSEDIDGTTVIIMGTDNNSTFSISTIAVNMIAQDDYYLGVGNKLSDYIHRTGDEKEVLFTNSWDIRLNSYDEAAGQGVVEVGKLC